MSTSQARQKIQLRQTTIPKVSEPTPFVRRLCGLNFLLCLGTAPMFIVFANKAMTFQVLYVAGGALSIASLLASVLGVLKSTPSLVWSLMFFIGVSYGLLCTGGLCVLHLPYADAELTSATDSQYAKSVVLQSEVTTQAELEQIYLQAGGITQLVLGVFSSYMVRQLFLVLGEKRGSVAFLQAFSMFMIPLSFLFIAGGQYIISSQTLASAPYTGIFIYFCGLMELVLSLLAFIGSGFEYRRLLNTFSWLSFLTAVSLLGASVGCFAVTSKVQTTVINNWAAIRVVLPPTLQARYDKTQFSLFVERNLHGMAYIGIISGLFMLLQSISAQSVRDITNVVKRRAAQDKRCALDPEVHPEFAARREWTLLFKSSKRNQRICMRTVCGFATILLLAITVVMTLSVIFTTQCASISKSQQTYTYPLANETYMCKTFDFRHEFSAGKLQVVRGNTSQGNVHLTQSAVSSKYLTAASISNAINEARCVVEVAPTQSPSFMWFDTSCQVANVLVELPIVTSSDDVPALRLTSKTTAIDVNLLQDGQSSLVHGINISTDQSNVNLYGAYVGSQGLAIDSNSGEINMTTVFVNATGYMGGKTKTTLSSSLGSITLKNASFLDSPLVASTDVSGILFQDVMTSVTHGHSSVHLKSSSGGIVASSLSADLISMQTTSGAITTNAINSNGNGVFQGRIDIQSIGGDVRLLNTVAKGYIHVETNSGNVLIHLASSSFVGLYYVRSEYGKVSVRHGNITTFDRISPLTTADPRESQGLINCDTSCHYVGDIYVRTIYGNIDLLVGCSDTLCT